MLAEVLTSAASWQSEHPLLTYSVPEDLQSQLQEGQLVAIPYGDRLVEGIIWNVLTPEDEASSENVPTVRPLHSILDPEPALLLHQRIVSEWIAEYYVTSLAQVAQMMLPPGLMQRSRVVLHLVEEEHITNKNEREEQPLRLQALRGLLLADGELDIEQLKTMLGPKKSREVLKEALESGLIEREAQLAPPRTRVRRKRIVNLLLEGEQLARWRTVTLECLQDSLPEPTGVVMAPDNVRRQRQQVPVSPWSLPEANNIPSLSMQNKVGLLAQHRLAAIELLEQSRRSQGMPSRQQWTPNMLAKASGLTIHQVQKLADEGVIEIEEQEVQRDPLLGRVIQATEPLTLTGQQQTVLDEILQQTIDDGLPIEDKEPLRPLLLHGITGSGKTEIYLQALAAIIKQGKRGIVLVPEIALTAQATQRFAARFPGRVAIIHSELSDGERYDEWRRIRAGKVDVVIGSRSALFAPMPEPGIIILDEEHEPAYKQSERRPTYHARDVAIAIGQILHIPVLLGSATPSIDTYYRSEEGSYQLLEMTERVGAKLPPVEIIDLRNELQAGNTSIISRRLHSELEQVLENHQQAILYLNRRGAASCVLCRECGFMAMCENCDIPLTYHATERVLLCHYCNQQSKVLQACPQCNSLSVRYFGLGTEKVQQAIQRAFPQARILRWDRDTARHRHAHEQLLDRFANREADIMIGTQMIAKGLDLPGVTLVGVVSADIALTLPDFSTAERAFTLLTQVAGRAGRGGEAGQVIIQTFNPEHFCIDTASHHDYHGFYKAEIELRRRYGYPPFRQFVKFTYGHENRQRSQNEALLLCEKLNQWIDLLKLEDTDIVGPAPALMERVRGKYRWQMIARGPELHQLVRVINAPGWEIDIDPVSNL